MVDRAYSVKSILPRAVIIPPAYEVYSEYIVFVFMFESFFFWKNFIHTFLRDYKAYKVETWYTRGQWVDVSCIPESGCSCLFIPLFLQFSFPPIFKHYSFRHTFLRNCEAYKIETWYTHRQWADVTCILE